MKDIPTWIDEYHNGSRFGLNGKVLLKKNSKYQEILIIENDFYGKAVITLSVYQLKVAMYGKVFHSIFQYTDDIPDNIREDPDKLMAFSEAQRNKDSNKSSSGLRDDADASAIFGATKDDMQQLASDGKAVSLSEEMEKAGGKLDMKQMMRLAGHDV